MRDADNALYYHSRLIFERDIYTRTHSVRWTFCRTLLSFCVSNRPLPVPYTPGMVLYVSSQSLSVFSRSCSTLASFKIYKVPHVSLFEVINKSFLEAHLQCRHRCLLLMSFTFSSHPRWSRRSQGLRSWRGTITCVCDDGDLCALEDISHYHHPSSSGPIKLS